jgi:pimeloyl-ACP methyl ester carboxylesterase
MINEVGSQPPLVWFFNGAAEPANLATALGPDQPLIYGRSLHLLVPAAEARKEPANIVARHYFETLQRHLTARALWLGANCQGEQIALPLFRHLVKAGFDVPALAFITNQLRDAETDRPALLIYGKQDDIHNPFVQDIEQAHARAAVMFSFYQQALLDVGHGQYLQPPAVDQVAAHLIAFRNRYVVTSGDTAAINAPAVGL